MLVDKGINLSKMAIVDDSENNRKNNKHIKADRTKIIIACFSSDFQKQNKKMVAPLFQRVR